MSVFRVITRIVPLTGNESSFEPASFDLLTNGSARDASVSTFTDPTSGITYRIERIEDLQHCEPCETVDSVNKAFAEKLSNIPGFVQIQDNDLQSDSYNKNFKFSFPQTVSLTKDALQSENSKFEISIVNNKKYMKLNKAEKDKTHSKIKNSEKSPKKFKSKCSTSMQNKLKKKHKIKSKVINKCGKKIKLDEEVKDPIEPSSNSPSCSRQTSVDEPADNDLNIEQPPEKNTDHISEIVLKNGSISGAEDIKNMSLNDLFDIECGELIINEPEATGLTSNYQNDKSSPNDNGDDSDLSFQTQDSSFLENACNICKTFEVAEDHPLYDMLQPLKKYFVSGECLICGFIPDDVDYNAAKHMEGHVATRSSFSYYKCFCCTEEFCSPRNLYTHALSREKINNYSCDICFLKFKRKHYLMCHNLKSHKVPGKVFA